MYLEKIDTWCYPLSASVWYNGGLTVTPNVNLVSNIDLVMVQLTTFENDKYFNMSVQSIGNLKHPIKIEQNLEVDKWTFNNHYGGKNLRFPTNLVFIFEEL